MSKFYTVNLPFPGFYNTLYSDLIDSEEQQWAEYKADESEDDSDSEQWWPEALQLSATDLSGLLFDATDYGACHRAIAHSYVDALNDHLGEVFDMTRRATRGAWDSATGKMRKVKYDRASIGMTFESMDSPREYNFATDRVYGNIPALTMRRLFKRSRDDDHATLAEVIRERFTSRSGFISGYSNDLETWLAKPLAEWDHNELGTLLIAAMILAGADPEDGELSIYYAVAEGSYQDWERGVDWAKLDSKRADMRAEKLQAWLDDDHAAAVEWLAAHPEQWQQLVAADPTLFAAAGELPTPRCNSTPDMFAS